jgi:aspartate aminotransferase-like enzyme
MEQMRRIRAGMGEIFGTKNDIMLICGSGRTGLEATVSTLFSAGDEVLSICSGLFGLMYAGVFDHFVQSHHLNAVVPGLRRRAAFGAGLS